MAQAITEFFQLLYDIFGMSILYVVLAIIASIGIADEIAYQRKKKREKMENLKDK